MTITKSKLVFIHVAKKQLGLSEDDYRSILALYGGAASSRDLDQDGFMAVMTRFEQLGFKSTSKRKPLAARTGMASPAQISLIRQRWAEFTNGTGTDMTLGKWLERQFKISAIQFVTSTTAPKVITAMNSMVRKKAHAHPAA